MSNVVEGKFGNHVESRSLPERLDDAARFVLHTTTFKGKTEHILQDMDTMDTFQPRGSITEIAELLVHESIVHLDAVPVKEMDGECRELYLLAMMAMENLGNYLIDRIGGA